VQETQNNDALINVPCFAKANYHTPFERVNGASVSLFQSVSHAVGSLFFGATATSGAGPPHS